MVDGWAIGFSAVCLVGALLPASALAQTGGGSPAPAPAKPPSAESGRPASGSTLIELQSGRLVWGEMMALTHSSITLRTRTGRTEIALSRVAAIYALEGDDPRAIVQAIARNEVDPVWLASTRSSSGVTLDSAVFGGGSGTSRACDPRMMRTPFEALSCMPEQPPEVRAARTTLEVVGGLVRGAAGLAGALAGASVH